MRWMSLGSVSGIAGATASIVLLPAVGGRGRDGSGEVAGRGGSHPGLGAGRAYQVPGGRPARRTRAGHARRRPGRPLHRITVRALGLEPGGEPAQAGPAPGVGRARRSISRCRSSRAPRRPGFTLTTRGGKSAATFTAPTDLVAYSGSEQPRIDINAPVVFVGYGIVAPEYKWNDYAGVDVKGKVVMVMVNDPPAPAAEPTLFAGKALTYYGRWMYKYEEAARQGAAGAILIHTIESRDLSVERRGVVLERRAVQRAGRVRHTGARAEGVDDRRGVAQTGRGRRSGSRRAAESGPDARREARRPRRQRRRRAAADGGAQDITQRDRRAEGHERQRRRIGDLYRRTTITSASSRSKTRRRDGIYNGARDNASGVAAILEIAEAFVATGRRGPRDRSTSSSTTGEESGLLGSEYFATHPTDADRQGGREHQYRCVERLRDDAGNRAARRRAIGPARRGGTRRSSGGDAGSVRMNIRSAATSIAPITSRSRRSACPRCRSRWRTRRRSPDRTRNAHASWRRSYNETCYHQACDEFSTDWDLSGAVEDLRLLADLGWRVAERSRCRATIRMNSSRGRARKMTSSSR